jgi:hypothetical protein
VWGLADRGLRIMVVPLMLSTVLFVAACDIEPEGERPSLGVDNGTTLAVTITVNESKIETVPPRTQRFISAGALPGMPWKVQALSPTGRLLLELEVVAGVVWQTTDPDGGTSMHGAANRVDLSCGRLDIYAGPPLIGPMPGPGTAGDCET